MLASRAKKILISWSPVGREPEIQRAGSSVSWCQTAGKPEKQRDGCSHRVPRKKACYMATWHVAVRAQKRAFDDSCTVLMPAKGGQRVHLLTVATF